MAQGNRQISQEEIENTVRRILQEEIGRENRGRTSGSNVFARTQSLIQSTIHQAMDTTVPVTSLSHYHNNNVTVTSTPTSFTTFPGRFQPSNTGANRRRSAPGHPNRYLAPKKKKASKERSKLVTVMLLKSSDITGSYRVDADNELLTGFVDIHESQSADDIINTLVTLFKTKYKFINKSDFVYVKRDRNAISVPVVAPGFEWTYDHILSLKGQGKLCCRLTVDEDILEDTDEEAWLPDYIPDGFISSSSTTSTATRSTTTPQPLMSVSSSRPSPISLGISLQSPSGMSHLSSQGPSSTSNHDPSTPNENDLSMPNESTPNENDLSTPNENDPPTPLIDLTSGSNEVYEVIIHRAKLFNDVIREFKEKDILTKDVQFAIMGYNGVLEAGRGSGVTREVISGFFSEFYGNCCDGGDEMIPILRHDLLKGEWESIARVICFAIKYEHFPIKMSEAFMKASFLSAESVSNAELHDSFLKYVPNDDKDTFISFLKDFGSDTTELLEVLDRFNTVTMPRTSEDLRELLYQIAHKEIIQKPRYVSSIWNTIFCSVHFPDSFDATNIGDIYKKKACTGKKVVALFKAEGRRDAKEEECFNHLKQFTRNLDVSMLQTFLRMMTGSDVITVPKIEVTFNHQMGEGADRRPVFRTCVPLIELPVSYKSAYELKEEFISILRFSDQGDVYKYAMDFV